MPTFRAVNGTNCVSARPRIDIDELIFPFEHSEDAPETKTLLGNAPFPDDDVGTVGAEGRRSFEITRGEEKGPHQTLTTAVLEEELRALGWALPGWSTDGSHLHGFHISGGK